VELVTKANYTSLLWKNENYSFFKSFGTFDCDEPIFIFEIFALAAIS